MEKIKKPTVKQSIIMTLLLGSGFVAGNTVDKPQCDYVYTTQENKEICLTEKEAILLKKELDKSAGFGGTRMGGTPIIKK